MIRSMWPENGFVTKKTKKKFVFFETLLIKKFYSEAFFIT